MAGTVSDDVVLMRTEAGQESVWSDLELTAAPRRLLLLVNGFTPLRDLSARLDAVAAVLAEELLSRGLVAPVAWVGEDAA